MLASFHDNCFTNLKLTARCLVNPGHGALHDYLRSHDTGTPKNMYHKKVK